MTTTNRLAGETSPYLRQHADNPVHWQPWGDEALALAEGEDKPLLLSVGYSACHWCHVMAHESFEDQATAAVMNELFVNVKVDREERPDVDAVYMEAVQAVAGSGGWPMTVFCLPDGRPFFAGTYFPRDRFVDLLRRVGEAWRTRRDGLETDAAQLSAAVVSGTGLPSLGWASDGDVGAARSPALLATAADALLARFDPEWGGFGRAPKFPQPSMLELLLQSWARTGRTDVLDAVTTSLDAMASGGIYDHLAGGFARYSTDRTWLVPHFEKMLYDNALLARTYLHAWQATGAERYRQVVTETLDYLLAPPMRQGRGGICSAEDADSEGVEGRFYVWDRAEVEAVAGAGVADWYGVTGAGNWEGHSILTRPARGDLTRPAPIEAGRRLLLEHRDLRVRPALDDKVLTEWNAMAVAALAEAGAAMGEAAWVGAAVDIATFLVDELRVEGRWRRSWQGGRARHLAYAADHAWLIEAFTRLSEATGRAAWLERATETAAAMLDLFWDEATGGLHTAGGDAGALIARPKDTYDGAIPSANSVAAAALLRLGALTGDERWTAHAGAIIDVMGPALAKAPTAFATLVAAADLAVGGIVEVAVTGDRPDLLAEVRRSYRPTVVCAWGEPTDSPLWAGRTGPDQAGLAFVCRDFACLAPVAEADALGADLAAAVRP